MKRFGSLKAIREASLEDLQQVSGISAAVAEQIKTTLG